MHIYQLCNDSSALLKLMIFLLPYTCTHPSRLKAAKEHPLNKLFKISKQANPVSESALPDLETKSMLRPKRLHKVGKRSYKKKLTLPHSPRNDSVDTLPPNTPPTPPTEDEESTGPQPNMVITASDQLAKEFPSDSTLEDDDESTPCKLELLVDLDNYRRFSSRNRKRPDFFSIADHQDESPHIAGVKRKRPVTPSARRLLSFNDLQTSGGEDVVKEEPSNREVVTWKEQASLEAQLQVHN